MAWETIVKEATRPTFWLYLLGAALFGALGGFVYELLMLQGHIERPHPGAATVNGQPFPHAVAADLYDLGVWGRILIGGAAAIAALWLVTPTGGATAYIATSVIAGSAGSAIFRSLQDRLVAALAVAETAKTKDLHTKQAARVAEIDKEFTVLKSAIETTAESPAATRSLIFNAGSTMPRDDLDRIAQLIGEARALGPGQ